ncbi:MAG: DNA polymerase III subunit beta [Hyphomicrobium sp.]|jgi:DNA polymerase-3 subunit beta
MRLVIERGELLRALGHVTSVVERRTTIPILSNVLLRARDSKLEFKATDLEREVIEGVPGDISAPGAVTVPAHMLHDIVRKLPDGSQVDIRKDGEKERLTLAAGQARFALQTLPAEDFPDIGSGEMGQEFELSAQDLKRLIDKTRFAISTEETRYYLNGIYLHTAQTNKKATLRAVATDGHRLAQVELPLPKGAQGMPGIIVPRKTVHELHRLIEDSSGAVKVGVSPAKVRFEIGSVTLTSKLIDGTFPDYSRVIPQGNDKEMKVSNAEFMGAVDRVSTIASERGRAVKLNIKPDKLVLSVNNPEGGSATEEIGVEYASSPLEIGFNARYLLDIAGQLEGEEACFKLADPGSPTMVNDPADETALYVLMPMRV